MSNANPEHGESVFLLSKSLETAFEKGKEEVSKTKTVEAVGGYWDCCFNRKDSINVAHLRDFFGVVCQSKNIYAFAALVETILVSDDVYNNAPMKAFCLTVLEKTEAIIKGASDPDALVNAQAMIKGLRTGDFQRPQFQPATPQVAMGGWGGDATHVAMGGYGGDAPVYSAVKPEPVPHSTLAVATKIHWPGKATAPLEPTDALVPYRAPLATGGKLVDPSLLREIFSRLGNLEENTEENRKEISKTSTRLQEVDEKHTNARQIQEESFTAALGSFGNGFRAQMDVSSDALKKTNTRIANVERDKVTNKHIKAIAVAQVKKSRKVTDQAAAKKAAADKAEANKRQAESDVRTGEMQNSINLMMAQIKYMGDVQIARQAGTEIPVFVQPAPAPLPPQAEPEPAVEKKAVAGKRKGRTSKAKTDSEPEEDSEEESEEESEDDKRKTRKTPAAKTPAAKTPAVKKGGNGKRRK